MEQNNPAVEIEQSNYQVQTPFFELSDLQLAFVGGGCGETIL